MITFKMPEAVAARWPTVPGSHEYCGCKGCVDLGGDMELLFTAEALRDVLEQAAQLCGAPKSNGDMRTAGDCEIAVRAMKEQIK